MLLGLGPFRFTVPNFSVESMTLRSGSRAVEQDVIGAVPPVHLLGPTGSAVDLESEFHPLHMNKNGRAMLLEMQAAMKLQTPLMFGSMDGFIFGRWILTSMDVGSSDFAPNGQAQTIKARISLVKYSSGAGGFLGLFL